MDFIMAAAGLVLLVFGGDVLVRGAVGLSLRLGIPALLVSLTVVAFGTSAPELLIGIDSALSGVPGIALGNVVGSNIANVLLVLGVPAVLAPIVVRECDSRRSYTFMLVATLIFIGMCFMTPLTWVHGLIMLAILAAMLYDNYRSAMQQRKIAGAKVAVDDLVDVDTGLPGWRLALYLVLGMILLPIGANLLVDGASEIARWAGVSDAVIGLTLVAIGTSLPELATTVMAALRRQADVALGNVIGSNLFNLLGIMGATVLFADIPVERSFLTTDLWIMLAASVALAPAVFAGWTLGRPIGFAFLALYGAFITSLVV